MGISSEMLDSRFRGNDVQMLMVTTDYFETSNPSYHMRFPCIDDKRRSGMFPSVFLIVYSALRIPQ